jgi:hypothetical protein
MNFESPAIWRDFLFAPHFLVRTSAVSALCVTFSANFASLREQDPYSAISAPLRENISTLNKI